jgi:hypothetical protein
MGYNSVLLVLNDCLNAIETDETFGKNLSSAVMKNGCYKKPVDISSQHYCNAATVISCEHADVTQIIAVGGNCATVLANIWGDHSTEEAKVHLLKNLADSMGYRIVKKAVK